MQWIEADITAPRGFVAAGVACGLKTARHALDLGILACETPAAAAGVFTKNKLPAAPVVLSRQRIRKGRIRAVVVNSGNANACTGPAGERDAGRMTTLAAGELGVSAADVLVASTGVIGKRLDMAKVSDGIAAASARLAGGKAASDDFTGAIMTTDAFPKACTIRVKVGRGVGTIAGVAKGAGMISPNMATMLAFITTDVALCPGVLRKALKAAVDCTFNRITVDGRCSTNDTVLLLASGLCDLPEIDGYSAAFRTFESGLQAVCERLAGMIVSDGEGATRVMEVVVSDAASTADAERTARALADNLLLKCALHGADPNWGRIACTVGSCGVKVDPAKLAIRIGGQTVYSRSKPRRAADAKAARQMADKQVRIEVNLGLGTASARVWGCDLSKKYVEINAEYHT